MKIFTVIIVLENHFQTNRLIQETNHVKNLITQADHQKKEVHDLSHKMDIVDQIVDITSIANNFHDQFQT